MSKRYVPYQKQVESSTNNVASQLIMQSKIYTNKQQESKQPKKSAYEIYYPQKVQTGTYTKINNYQLEQTNQTKVIQNKSSVYNPKSTKQSFTGGQVQNNNLNNDQLICMRTKQALSQIIGGKFNPSTNQLKNIFPKLNDVIVQFSTVFNQQRIKSELLRNLEQLIKNDILSLLRQKYQVEGRERFFSESSQKFRLQNQNGERLYNEVKSLFKERQRTAVKSSENNRNINKQKELQQIRREYKLKQQEYSTVLKDNIQLKNQIKRLSDQLIKQRARAKQTNHTTSQIQLSKQLQAAKEEIRKLKAQQYSQRQDLSQKPNYKPQQIGKANTIQFGYNARTRNQSPNYEKLYQALFIENSKIVEEIRILKQEKRLENDRQASKGPISQKQFGSLKDQMGRKDKQLKQQAEQIKNKSLQIQQLEKKQYQLTDQLLSARKEIQSIEQKFHKLQRQSQRSQFNQSLIRTPKNDERQRLQKRLKQKDEQINDLTEQITLLNKILQDKEEPASANDSGKTKQLEEQVKKLKEQLQLNEIKYKQTYKKQSQELQQMKKTLQMQKISANKTIGQLQNQCRQLKNRMKALNQSKISSPSNDSTQINMLYQHQILYQRFQDKKYLTQTIEFRRRSKIVRTRLLYRYDTLNKVNFHRYIDGIPNVLVIVKTQGGSYIAAFTQSPFSKERNSDGDGMLISITNRKYFTLVQQNRKAISYDDYYIIFGNSELRIRSQENTVFSNFGISNSYYASRGERVNILLGQREREVEFENYEIYQIIFDN